MVKDQTIFISSVLQFLWFINCSYATSGQTIFSVFLKKNIGMRGLPVCTTFNYEGQIFAKWVSRAKNFEFTHRLPNSFDKILMT